MSDTNENKEKEKNIFCVSFGSCDVCKKDYVKECACVCSVCKRTVHPRINARTKELICRLCVACECGNTVEAGPDWTWYYEGTFCCHFCNTKEK